MTAEQADKQDTATRDDDRPKPYPHEGDSRPDNDSGDAAKSEEDSDSSDDDSSKDSDESSDSSADSDESSDSEADSDGGENKGDKEFKYGEDETQDFVDRDKIDFDPADGLYTGTAVDGGSDIPGPSEGEIREAQEEAGDDEDGDAGARKAAEKFIEENDVDLEEAKKGEAIAGSAKSSGDKGDDT